MPTYDYACADCGNFDALRSVGVPRFDMAKDMQRFATYIEAKKVASGGWRGTILNKDDALAAAAAKAPIAKTAPEAPGASATGSL